MAVLARVQQASDPFSNMHREFDSMLGQLFGGRQQQNSGAWAPYAVDVREDADHIYVDAELPGFRKEDVDITLENSTLTISAERKEEKTNGNGHDKGEWLLNERRYNRFLRSFALPPTVDEKRCEAKLMDGVLHLTLFKREETKPHKIQVS